MKQVYKMIGFYLNEDLKSCKTMRRDSRGSGGEEMLFMKNSPAFGEIDVSGFSPGLYVLKVVSNKEVLTEPFIVH